MAINIIAFTGLAFICLVSATIYPKQLAGPPSEFAAHQLPTPDAAAQVQQSALVPMWVTSDDKSMASFTQDVLWSGPIYVDSATEFQFAYSSPYASSTTITLVDPNGNNVALGAGFPGSFPIGGTSVPETTWILTNPVVGTYTLTITSTDATMTRKSVQDDDIPIGYAITYNASPISMVGHLNTYQLQQGQNIGLVAMIVDNPKMKDHDKFSYETASIMTDVIFDAYMEVTLPDGTEQDVQMLDDGLHSDGLANDGIYGGSLAAAETGVYKAQAFLQGKNADGVEFLRTTQHLLASVSDALSLVGTAVGVMTDANHMTISLSVDADTLVHDASQNFNTYAEVWGVDSNGNDAPACWIGGISYITDGVINMVLDTDWLSYSNVEAPLTLKNILIQEVSGFVPLASSDSIAVTVSAVTKAQLVSLSEKNVSVITKEMKQGVFPEALLTKPGQAANEGLILVHGYCSTTNPWDAYPGDWTGNVYYFLNPSASISHDSFAQLVMEFADSQGLTSYGIVGHSQGGIVGTHMLNFYFSNLDKATKNEAGAVTYKKIQSLGSPYEGCTAAGSAANLGEAFGIGCGTNFDLSLDGSKLWGPSITPDTRDDIYYYTTTYKQGNFFGDYCNMAINMILEWPNDGTTEFEYADLIKGNFMGNTEKQCHVTDMAYPAQYYDHARNKVMNDEAARS